MASRGGSTERPRRTPTLSRAVWKPSKAVLSALSYGPLRMRVTGKEHLPTHGPVLIACNHVSFVDPLLVGIAALPRPLWTMGKQELFNSRLLDAWLSCIGG
ncbi:MAG: lysophospholipid acyltransferase family protein, partial [Actinomycetota bacterium]|nr:lysophospholipid acyltransferase family protein [Actinomycetota bacterium]